MNNNHAMTNGYLRWFRRVAWIGIFLNLCFAIPALVSPTSVLASMGMFGDPTVWLRNAGMLVLSLSIVYVPVAVDPMRFSTLGWIAVFCRLIAGVFWIWIACMAPTFSTFLPMVLTDGPIGVILGTLLFLGLPPEKRVTIGKIGRVLAAPFRLVAYAWRSTTVRIVAVTAFVLIAVLGYEVWNNLLRQHDDISYATDEEQFKYGAIGLGINARVPYYLFKVLPEIFADKLPGPGGYASFGLITEPGKDLPIGFARRQIGYESVEPNCAFCHTGSFRESPTAERKVILGGPAHELDLEAFQWFLYDCARDPRFNADTLMAHIDRIADLSFMQRAFYRYLIIPFAKSALSQQAVSYAWQKSRPPQGRGRTDTFNPTKINVFHYPDDGTIGTVDLPQVWNQRPRIGMWLHWDGNNDSITERNYAAAMAIGATPTSVIPANFKRVTNFLLGLAPPKFPFAIDSVKAMRGRVVFESNCASCHAFGSKGVGQVTPLEEIGTDPHRLFSFTAQLVVGFHTFNTPPFVFGAYRKTYGYANTPIDGIWARAPYLHNGSIPDLWTLLQRADERPTSFYRGYNVYDPINVGFIHSGPEAEKGGFKYDTGVHGNGNQGHLYGTTLSDADKWDLIEFLKTM